MTTQKHEQLSAFIDGELDSDQSRQLISDILQDDEMRSRWASYHLVSDTMKGEQVLPTIELADRISAALDDEPTILAPGRIRRAVPAMVKQVAGMAIAATVAAAAVLMIQPEEQNVFQPGSNIASTQAAPASRIANTQVVPVTVKGVNWSVAKPSVASKLNSYLVNHNGYSTPVRGNLHFAPIVSYENNTASTGDETVLEYNPNGSSVRR